MSFLVEDFGVGNGVVERWGANRVWMVEKWVFIILVSVFFVRFVV